MVENSLKHHDAHENMHLTSKSSLAWYRKHNAQRRTSIMYTYMYIKCRLPLYSVYGLHNIYTSMVYMFIFPIIL